MPLRIDGITGVLIAMLLFAQTCLAQEDSPIITFRRSSPASLPGDDASENSNQRGGHVQWARLQTHYQWWSRHTETESYLLRFIRRSTSLGVDPAWAAADLYDEKSICAYPFVYAEGIQTVTDKDGQRNLREYLLRGGFLLIDACINPSVNPDPDIFLQQQVQRFHEFLPEGKIHLIPNDNEIFRCFFELQGGVPHSFMGGVYDARWARHGLYAVDYDGRVVSVISLSGLKCGYSFPNQPHPLECMQMLVNIYVYAVTH